MKKLIGIFVGLTIAIVATPFVMSTFVNSKIESTIIDLQQKGVAIKEIDKSSGYLSARRVYQVELTDKSLTHNTYYQQSFAPLLKKVVFTASLEYSHLPITDITSRVELKSLDLQQLADMQNDELNVFLKDKIKGTVITSDFKNFNYTLDDMNFDVVGDKIDVKGISGVYQLRGEKRLSKSMIDEITVNSKEFGIKFLGMGGEEERIDDVNSIVKSHISSIQIKSKMLNGEIKDVVFNGNSSDKKGLLDITSQLKIKFVDILGFFGKIELSEMALDLGLANINAAELRKILERSTEMSEKQEAMITLLEKGVTFTSKFNISDIKASNMSMGNASYNLTLDLLEDKVKKAGGIMKAINEKNYSVLKGELHLFLSGMIFSQVQMMQAQKLKSMIAQGYIKVDQKGNAMTVIRLDGGALTLNGKAYNLLQ